MNFLKRAYKRNTHNFIFKNLAGFSRAINRAYENRNHDIYSNGESRILSRIALLNPGVIFDVGANTGDYSSCAMKTCPTAKIFAFEPVQETYQKFKESVGTNERVTIENFALSEETGEADINIYSSDEHASLYNLKGTEAYKEKSSQVIKLKKGDDYLAENDINTIDFLKIDTEGNEYKVLQGFKNALAEKRIKVIQFEYGYINKITEVHLSAFYKLLIPLGYRIGKIYPKSVEFREYDKKYEDFIGPNMLAVSDKDPQLFELLR